jgi:hypothetical protein
MEQEKQLPVKKNTPQLFIHSLPVGKDNGRKTKLFRKDTI